MDGWGYVGSIYTLKQLERPWERYFARSTNNAFFRVGRAVYGALGSKWFRALVA
jgi:hypothetical protein